MRMFLRKSASRRDPLPVAMSGVRMGERVLQVGINNPALAGAIGTKVGLSGHAALVVTHEAAAEKARLAAAEAGGLIEITVTPLETLPFSEDAFDVVVINSADGLIASLPPASRLEALRECRRVLRHGGRVVAIEAGARAGLGALFRPAPKPNEEYEQNGGIVAGLEQAGFKPVRVVGDRDGYRFTEGLKSGPSRGQ